MAIDKTYLSLRSPSSELHVVDQISSDDLLIDELYSRLDSTTTSMGRNILYFWLRTQCKTEEALGKRRRLIDYFIADGDARARAKGVLRKIGFQANANVASLLWIDSGDKYYGYRKYLIALIGLELASLLAGAALRLPIMLVAIAAVLINIAVFLRTTKYISGYSNSIYYLGKALNRLAGLARIEGGDQPDEFRDARGLAEVARRMPMGISVFQDGASMMADVNTSILYYVRIFLLGELITYFRYFAFFRAHLEELRAIYELIGKIDAAACLADAIEASGLLRPAELSDDGSIGFKDVVNPLVAGCTPISIERLDKAIITGTNMSGKTTFLRTVGINQVLALGIQYAYAERFRTGFYAVYSSIQIEDDLLNGRSRYLVQARRLLELIERARAEEAMLIIDEILTGTNSRDRILASINILKHVGETRSIVLATTHDIEIAEGVSPNFGTYYFSEAIVGDDLAFDYRIKRGIVDKRNALAILKHLGFSRFIDIE